MENVENDGSGGEKSKKNESEDENKRENAKNRSPSPNVKSTAVVKYAAFQSPVEYSRLQCNTDLNLPPSKWGATIDSYGLKQILATGSGFSSFRMANMFPDCIGMVDVIADSETVKKVLKTPYQPNEIISMIVHQIGGTLLMDDFNFNEHMMKAEWSWFREFFCTNIAKTMADQEGISRMLPARSPPALQRHFLSHSVAALPQRLPHLPIAPLPGPFLPEPEIIEEEPPYEHSYSRNVLWTFEDIHMLVGSDLPIFGDVDRPCVSLRLRDVREPINVLTGLDYWLDNLMCNVPEVLMCYHLDGIVKKYEQMKTEDLPKLSGSKFSPKVINNVAQNMLSFLKANVTKAGHTYWLFKGPMDDVVKLYDLTPLCPDGVDNPFTTPVAMLLYRVARNMRLTGRSRHVERLLEHALRLLEVQKHPHIVASSCYMLADLYVPVTTDPACPNFQEESSDSDSDSDVPCAEGGRAEPAPAPQRGGGGAAESTAIATQFRGLALSNIGARDRGKVEYQRKRRERRKMTTQPERRCAAALRHALRGLRALRHVALRGEREEERERLKQQIIKEELHPKMANPNEPIKMNYEPIAKSDGKTDDKKGQETKEHKSRSRGKKRDKKPADKQQKAKQDDKKTDDSLIHNDDGKERDSNAAPERDRNAILIRQKMKRFTKLKEPIDDNYAWKLHLKTLLYEKICLVMATLAELNYKDADYGLSLKHIVLAGRCQKLLSNMLFKSEVVDASCLLGRAGDNYFQMSKRWGELPRYVQQYGQQREDEAELKGEIEGDMAEEAGEVAADEFDLEVQFPDGEGGEAEAMELACEQYARALRVAAAPRAAELRRRRASVRNELGVLYMNRAKALFEQYQSAAVGAEGAEAEALLARHAALSARAGRCLEEAARAFAAVADAPNLALLRCNQGRYTRLRAYCCGGGAFTAEQRKWFARGEALYLEALALLGGGGSGGAGAGGGEGAAHPELRALVAWELSSHAYTLATNMHHAFSTNEVAEAYRAALRYCPLSPGPKQHAYQFRASLIHYKLASLYHEAFERATGEAGGAGAGARRRALLGWAGDAYGRAAALCAALEDAPGVLRARAAHARLLRAHAQVTPNLKLKSLQTALQLLRQCHSVMELLQREAESDDETSEHIAADGNNGSEKDEVKKLLEEYQNSLNDTLKCIIQYCKTKSNKDYDKMTNMYKKLYGASLRIKNDQDIRIYAGNICNVLSSMDSICKEFE